MSQRSPLVLAAVAGIAVSTAVLVAALASPSALSAQPATPPAPNLAGLATTGSAGYHRIELPGGAGKPFPYTIEIPAEWQVHQSKDSPGLWLGPADAQPPDDPRLVYVRISRVSLADPAAIVASIKASDAADASWSAPLVEVREVGGVKGVLVQMESGEGAQARSSLTLKMPLAKTSVDFIGSARKGEFAKLRPTYERVLFSVRPMAEPLAPKLPKPPVPKPADHPSGQL